VNVTQIAGASCALPTRPATSKLQDFQSSPTGFTRGDNLRGGRLRQHREVTTRLAATAAAFVLFYPLGLALIVLPLKLMGVTRIAW
jgi:hypothetical protein